MTDKVDGGGACPSAPETTDAAGFMRRHEWRMALQYQVLPPPPKIQSALPGQVRVFTRYYCIFCLEERDKEVPTPINAPIVVTAQIVMAQQAPVGPLRIS